LASHSLLGRSARRASARELPREKRLGDSRPVEGVDHDRVQRRVPAPRHAVPAVADLHPQGRGLTQAQVLAGLTDDDLVALLDQVA